MYVKMSGDFTGLKQYPKKGSNEHLMGT